MYKKVIAIISGSIVICSLLVMSMALNIKEANAIEVNNKLKLNEQVKYTMVKGKSFENGYKATVIHKFSNKTELNDFVFLAHDKVDKLSNEKNFDQSFIATTTLKKALSLNEFEDFVLKYDLNIYDYKIREMEDNGTRITIGSKPTDNSLINQDEIIDAVGNNTFVGVIAFTCNVTEDNFNKIMEMKNDNSVYVVDVDSYLIGKDVKEQTDKDIVKIKTNDIYWYLEDYKIIKYK